MTPFAAPLDILASPPQHPGMRAISSCAWLTPVLAVLAIGQTVPPDRWFDVKPQGTERMRLADFDAAPGALAFAFSSRTASEILITDEQGLEIRRFLNSTPVDRIRLTSNGDVILLRGILAQQKRVFHLESASGKLSQIGEVNEVIEDLVAVGTEPVILSGGHLLRCSPEKAACDAVPNAEFFPPESAFVSSAFGGHVAMLLVLEGRLIVTSKDGVVQSDGYIQSPEIERRRQALSPNEGLFSGVTSGPNSTLYCFLGPYNAYTGFELLQATPGGHIQGKYTLTLPLFPELKKVPTAGSRLGNLTGHIAPAFFKHSTAGRVYLVDSMANRVVKYVLPGK